MRVRENDEYAAFARRVLRAYARRVADGDIEALTLMIILADEIDTAIARPSRPARLRLLLGRDRLPARHHPPGRLAALGRQAVSYRQIQPEDPARAAEWLLAEYDATDIEELHRPA